MKFTPNYQRLGVVLLGIFASTFLSACSGDTGIFTNTPAENSDPLAEYTTLLTYTPAGAKQEPVKLRDKGDTKQQSFTIPEGTTLNLLSVRYTLFSSSSCDYGTKIGTVSFNGASINGVVFQPGTYTTSNDSNNLLYYKLDQVLSTSFAPESAQGIRTDFRYSADNGGPGWVSTPCVASGIGSYDISESGDSCTGGSISCGFKIEQNADLPSRFTNANSGTLPAPVKTTVSGSLVIASGTKKTPLLRISSNYGKLASRIKTSSSGRNYIIVEPGDTLYRISINAELPMEQLRQINHLKGNEITINSKLFLN